jgi:hypothetical protein
MMFYTAEAAMLLLAGVALPSAIAQGCAPKPARPATPETVPDTAAA